MDPERIAETYWALHTQPASDWSAETVFDGCQKAVSGGILLVVILVFSVWKPRWRKGWRMVFGMRVNRRSFRDSLVEKGRTDALAEVKAAQDELSGQGRAGALAEVAAAQDELVKRGRADFDVTRFPHRRDAQHQSRHGGGTLTLKSFSHRRLASTH